MSWWINLAAPSTNVPALKARVQAHDAPQAVRDELCRRIDDQVKGITPDPKTLVTVFSYGHVETWAEDKNPYRGATDLKFYVGTAPFIDTPLEEPKQDTTAVGTGG